MDPSTPSSISSAEFPLVFHPAVPVTQLSSHSAPASSPQPLNGFQISPFQPLRQKTNTGNAVRLVLLVSITKTI